MSAPPSWFPPGLVLLDDRCPLPLDRPFTSAQARELGVSRWFQRRLVAEGLIRELVHGVYAVAQLVDSLELRVAALRMVVPRGAVVTDRTAAWLHGVDILPRSAVHEAPPLQVFSRELSRLRRPGVNSGVRTLTDLDVVEVGGVLVTTPLRTVLDLGRLLPRYDALAAMDGFLRIGVSRAELLGSVERFKGERGVIQLRELAPLADARAESAAESALRGHWIDQGLPAPELQWWVLDDDGIGVFRLDLALPDCRFGAEYNGKRFHTGEATEQQDADRLDWLERARGWSIEVMWRDNVYGPDADAGSRLAGGLKMARNRMGLWVPQGKFL